MTFKRAGNTTSPNITYDKTSKTTDCCAVCGDLATGFHYEVASCNGCKTFFRRTLVSNRIYKCHKNGNCKFDKDMRCACRACRFDKCVAVGMNPKAIQCNRTGRILSPQETPPASTTSSNSSSESDLPQQQQASTSTTIEKELHRLFPQTTPFNRKRSSTSPDSETTSKRAYTISALLNIPKSGTTPNMDENSRRSQPEESSSPTTTDITSSIRNAIQNHCHISEKHEKLISQLVRAHEGINEMLYPENCDTSISMLDVLARPSIATASPSVNNLNGRQRKCYNNGPGAVLNQKLEIAVEYAKTFEFFQWMPVQDKVILLRDVAFVLILLETAYERVTSKSASVLNHRNQKERQSSEENSGMSVIIESLNRARLDRKEFLLLKAIAFVHSECFGLSPNSYRQLSHQRQLVLDTLFNYMMSKHEKQGPVRYGHALSVLWTVYKATNSYLESLVEMELEPLTAELLANKLPERLT